MILISLEKQSDEEIVLQTVYTLFRFLQHKESRTFLLTKTSNGN